ncbi:MAG: glycosyltransferase family 4 protein [Sedimentisphaerales bacterium]|nr:glycosyltransferase family 4 protein [Sedimentisphaerales bacterium]
MSSDINSKTIKVCFIAPKAYPLFNRRVESVFGGAEVDLYYLATELAKDKDFRVSFIVADYGQAVMETIENVTIIKSLDFQKNALTGARHIWRAMKQADADIYLIKTASLGVPLAAYFCKRCERAFIYRTASMLESNGIYLEKHFFLGRLFARSLRQAEIVFTQNHTDRDNLQRTVGVSSVVIPNGHHLPKLTSKKREYILWVGRSEFVKGPDKFIELAGEFPNEKFVMICQRATGDNNYDSLCGQAEEVDNLEFHQRVPFDEIDGYFQRAKLLVNTSDSEGFPNTFIQACKWATAIVSLGVNPDGFLDKYSCGISCDGRFARMREAVKRLLAEDRYLELGRNGRKYVEDHHDIKKIIERYKTIFARFAREP